MAVTDQDRQKFAELSNEYGEVIDDVRTLDASEISDAMTLPVAVNTDSGQEFAKVTLGQLRDIINPESGSHESEDPGGDESGDTSDAVKKIKIGASGQPISPSSGIVTLPAYEEGAEPNPNVFGASGLGHSTGLVPDPGAIQGATKFLREDGTWQEPPAGSGEGGTQSDWNVTDTGSAAFIKNKPTTFGPSGSGHKSGFVPDPGATAGSAKFLREDGTWQAPPNTKVTSADNHYAPSENEGSQINASGGDAVADGTSVQVVTGIKRDAKGHVTGVVSKSVKSGGSGGSGGGTVTYATSEQIAALFD